MSHLPWQGQVAHSVLLCCSHVACPYISIFLSLLYFHLYVPVAQSRCSEMFGDCLGWKGKVTKSAFQLLEPLPSSLATHLLLTPGISLSILKEQNSAVRRRKLVVSLCWTWRVDVHARFWTSGVGRSIFIESVGRLLRRRLKEEEPGFVNLHVHYGTVVADIQFMKPCDCLLNCEFS